MSKMTGAAALVHGLKSHGVDTVFGIPGVQLDTVFHALHTGETPIRTVVPRHEQATTYMADGYARASGKVGVAMVVPGPGVLNAMAGLSTAYATSAKVLMIAPEIVSTAVGQNRGLLHEIKSQNSVLAAATKANFFADSAERIAPAVDDAMRAIHRGRPRPVSLEVPYDVLARPVNDAAATHGTDANNETPQPNAAQLDQVAALLSKARFPLIVAGGGVIAAGASEELQLFADRLGAPVVMSENGRGALSDRHPLALNVADGQEAFQYADVVLIIGSRFVDLLSGMPCWQSSSIRFIWMNIELPDAQMQAFADTSIQCDAKTGLAELADRVRPVTAKTDALTAVEAIRSRTLQRFRELQPLFGYVEALREAIAEDDILVNELTQVGYLARVAYPVYRPGTLLGPGYQGTLGYGFPTALGAAVGCPEKRVVSIVGDGGFGWNLQELATAARYRLRVTVVLFNDGHFGNVRTLQLAQFGNAYDTRLCNPDFLKLADAFGVPAVSVSGPAELASVLRSSFSTEGPSLIEVKVGEMPSPWHLLRLQPPQKR